MIVHKVICKKCTGESRLEINKGVVNYIDQSPIISARFRSDLQWGFECACGNDSRLCKEELQNKEAQVKIKGSSKETIDRVIDRMKQSREDSFIMQEL